VRSALAIKGSISVPEFLRRLSDAYPDWYRLNARGGNEIGLPEIPSMIVTALLALATTILTLHLLGPR